MSGTDDIILAALRAVLVEGRPATDVVGKALRGIATHDERRAIKDAVFGVSVLRLRLAFIAGTDDVAALLRCWRDDVGDGDVRWPGDEVEGLAVRRSCPAWLTRRLVDARGLDGADAFLAAANVPGPATLRANTLRGDRASLRAALDVDGIVTVDNDATPWAVDVVGHANLFGCAAFRAGAFEVQDASSQRVIAASGAGPGDVVIDLCAGRGGKTLGLAALMQNRGRLIAHDVDGKALRDLRGRLGRAGTDIVEVVDDVCALPVGVADVVVVDAPCSSTGVLRRSPDLRFALRKSDVDAVVEVQRALLARAAALVRPGGRVVYATCSVLRAENDDIVDDAGDMLDEKERRHLGAPFDAGDGFFFAAFLRRRAADVARASERLSPRDPPGTW